MEAIFIYLLKSSSLIAIFFLAYHLLLREETFFKSNRWFLLFGLVTSVLLPLVTFKKVVWVEPAMASNWTEVVPNAAVTISSERLEIDWLLVAASIYAIGIIIAMLKFVFDFTALMKALRGKTITQQADFRFIDVNEKVSPFSYFNYIVYNSSLYTESELENILEHEKVHCEQNHSADVLIARIFRIVFWYNPFAWLYEKAVLQNLEFIADSEALKKISDRKSYQITLLKVTTHENCVAISNHFYQSLIKKRIIMLNKIQSKKSNSWKYALIVPALAAFLFYFQVKLIAQEKSIPLAEPVAVASIEAVNIVVDKNTSDAELRQHEAMMKEKYSIKLHFSKVKRNSAGEIISIKSEYKDGAGHKGTYAVNGDEAIKPFNIIKKDNGSIGFGSGDRQMTVIRRNSSAENDDSEENAPEAPLEPLAPIAPFDSEDVIAYTYDVPGVPDMPGLPDAADQNTRVVVKTINGKNGKVTVMVNGEVIDVDPDKIMADVDVQKAMKEANVQMKMARKQMKGAHPQMMKAKRHGEEAREDAENAREEMEQAREELEESRQALEEAREQLEESRREFERQKAKTKTTRSKNTK